MKLKQIATALLALGAFTAAGVANASTYPEFTVNPGYFPGYATAAGFGTSPFVADRITGGYVETITFGVGTFNISLLFQASQFYEGNIAISNNTSGLTNNYGLYAQFLGSGTVTTNASGTTFSLNPGGTLAAYIDHNGVTANTQFAATAANGSTAYAKTNDGDDTLIATGAGITGTGTVTCDGTAANNNCGSFGQTTSFNLVSPAGTSYFINPVPFYNLSMQSGNFNGFIPTAGTTQNLQGTMNVVFQDVPEPASIALVGAAFVGMGFVSRRKKI